MVSSWQEPCEPHKGVQFTLLPQKDLVYSNIVQLVTSWKWILFLFILNSVALALLCYIFSPLCCFGYCRLSVGLLT